MIFTYQAELQICRISKIQIIHYYVYVRQLAAYYYDGDNQINQQQCNSRTERPFIHETIYLCIITRSRIFSRMQTFTKYVI